MEPQWEGMELHPAILIASGVECIDSRDVRFLNAYRRFFAREKYTPNISILIRETDFQLGGIMNPNDLFIIPSQAYSKYQSRYSSFPCLTMKQIRQLVYQKRLQQIATKIWDEVNQDIRSLKIEGADQLYRWLSRPTSAGEIYPKIVALHLCGLGEKLRDAFGLVLDYYLSKSA